MAASESKLVPLSSTHELKLACTQCSVKEKEVTYTLKPVLHQCARTLLLCRAKGGSKWRPVSKRPMFPNPNQYQMCLFYVEGHGCTSHKNRCTFARSVEEATVWTFEKRRGLDHMLLCKLVAQSETGGDPPGNAEPLGDLLPILELKAACDQCFVKEKKITRTVQLISHNCRRDLLLAKDKACHQWKPVADRPAGVRIGPNVFYQVCRFHVEGSGSECTYHGAACTFAKSSEEAVVWNHLKDHRIDKGQLIRQVVESERTRSTPESAAESIRRRFSGEFIELCRECFNDCPQKLTLKKWNSTCSADSAHTWDPVLVHHLSENSSKHVYSQVRPLLPNSQFTYCSHVRQGKPCWHQPGHCGSAQSEVEMAVWEAERGGLSVRPLLLQVSQGEQTEHRKKVTMYCKVCLLVLSSPESFYKHCSSLEHSQLLAEDTTTRWRGRPPPHNHRSELWLCERPQTCEYGSKCPKAHSVEELQEWLMRAEEEKEIRHNIGAQGLMSYNESLLEEYKNTSNEAYIVSEEVDDVSISCDKELSVQWEQINATFQWDFKVETERQLVHVALLKQEPGASFTLRDLDPAPCIHSSGEPFLREDMTYDITVSFTASNPGLYDQWLVLDFNARPVLLKKLRVRVGQPSLDDVEQPTSGGGATFQSAERWHRGNRVIIPCTSRTEEQEELLKEYKAPQISFQDKSSNNSQTPLNPENYKERMHDFLYNEERAEDQIVSRLNVCGQMTTCDRLSGTKFTLQAPPGELFCAVSIPFNLTPDTPEGLALKRSIQSALIAPLSSSFPNPKVYEAIILPDKTSENKMHLQLSKKCCSDLALRSDDSYPMEVQFQLDRLGFCTMHKAVDLLPDTKRVLPDLHDCIAPVNNVSCEKLNAKQLSAINFITGVSNGRGCVAPLLVYGPFGTGKTFTLATAARELCKQPHKKVLICTHTNSSADLYVRDHFHPFIDQKNRNNEMRPIRIKTNSKKAYAATDDVTQKYCLLSRDGQFFLPPTKAALDGHKLVITTTTMARRFHDLKLPEGYFTHILIDEASQMLECEALMALGLAGPNTRVALAGDHMQMGPKLFSVDDHHRSNHTLLTRLFHYYQGQKCDAAQNSRIIFNENYRSSKEIVEFVSTHFYVGQQDVIKAVGDVPAPENGHALKFHHVRGECLLDSVSLSWYNQEEVVKVVEEVKEVLKDWPMSWGTKNLSSICILSEGNQVRQIRTSLSRRNLSGVHVENLANVQGKQFRVVILSAVQTRDSLKTSHLPGLELFNDARVLNTAMTRAQSLVVVVGDAAALCCFGKCSAVWKSYIDHCISNNSVSPRHYAQGFFEKDVMETARFQKSEQVHETNTLNDAILQELTDEYKQLREEDEVEKCRSNLKAFDNHQSKSSHDVSELLALCEKYPGVYRQGKLVRETARRGYVVPFRNPGEHIIIDGWKNLKEVFSGDEVVVDKAEVIGITKEAKSARELVCILEDEDHSKSRQNSYQKFVRRTMIPITRSAPKICILLLKEERNFLPIWEQIDGVWIPMSYTFLDGNLKENSVFVVQVIGWKEHCHIPLGKVIKILPIGGSFSAALQILNEEFKVAPNTCMNESHGVLTSEDEDRTHRKDVDTKFTFTVDPENARDLDDAISVMEIGDHEYELGVHIADVASYVSKDCELDCDSKQRGVTYYGDKHQPRHMFPEDATEHFSLLPGKDKRVVSLMFKVKKQTNEIIGEPKFQLSSIKSNRKLSYKEAGDMITERYRDIPRFDSIEDCVTVAYCFAKAQRMLRPVDWVYSQPEEDRWPGKRKANLMIEELSVLFNTHASKCLMGSKETMYCTPLRCQAEPAPQKIEEFKKKCGELISLSFHVKDRVDHDNQAPNCENFRILTEVWEEIQAAAGSDDVDSMVDLIAADDIHPLLQPVIDQFRRCQRKAEVLCSMSSDKAQQGHYFLKLPSYTYASSPIRRYIDLISQRLLHSIICNRRVQYNTSEIKTLCSQFEDSCKDAKAYEQKADQIRYAVTTRHQSAPSLAFVVSPNKDHLAVAFPFNKNALSERVSIAYRDLQLCDQPVFDEANNCVTLKWNRRIYAVDNTQIHQELQMPGCDSCVELPLAVWKDIIEAVDTRNWDHAKSLTIEARILQQAAVVPQSSCIDKQGEQEHEVAIELQLQRGATLKVQMTTEIRRGYHMPAVQLVCVKPQFEICVHHVRSCVTCFSRFADSPSRIFYLDPEEYVRIWKPMCDMESVFNAVEENYSITIENLVVNFTRAQEGTLAGSFFLPVTWIKNWAIECNLWKCLLCIRKRGLTLDSAPVESRPFTWVAHCLIRKVAIQNKPPNEGSTVDFSVNHLAMDTIPDCVYRKNTRFTVEIIPKLIPDVRNEEAVLKIPSACDLVTTIALGKHIPREVEPSWHRAGRDLPPGIPHFNVSQRLAVEKALNHTFTLIQGPPGTGKTVVGAYIVSCFVELNSLHPRKVIDPKDEGKKQVILYCGPSNKSVDVVAENLLKFGDRLRPLRVYSKQVEMLDYPFPDSALRFSQRPHRQEKSKKELRGITLHHRMRQDKNPYSRQIKEFDERIRDALSNNIQLTDEEVDTYKSLLKKARISELQQHDIILCTCTQSSNQILTSTLAARQIIIDECAMATEPQALIPLVCNQPEKIVLIGDHKQLRPIVKHEGVRKLGMTKSLFERYYMMHKSRAVMLDTQYRMHEEICEFPSQEFYEGKLKTGVEQPSSVLRVRKKTTPIVFGHIIGKTISLVVNTAKGNENSKANMEERDKAIEIATKLVENAKIKQQDIVILTPYNAQVSEIKDGLKEKKMDQVLVTTITKSQGSEWRYVILSTVCSLPEKEIEEEPDGAWFSKHLGFVGDPNQINVGITRAKEGLCIIGNQLVLSKNRTWKKLISHYRGQYAVTDAQDISVLCK